LLNPGAVHCEPTRTSHSKKGLLQKKNNKRYFIKELDFGSITISITPVKTLPDNAKALVDNRSVYEITVSRKKQQVQS